VKADLVMEQTETRGQKALFRSCRQLRKEGRTQESVNRLVQALRAGRLDSEGVLQAGRLLDTQDLTPAERPCRVQLLGQCTTAWLAPALTATAAGRGATLSVTEEDYDNVLQGLMSVDESVQTIVLLPWNQRLFGTIDRDDQTRVLDELQFWQQAWQLAAKHSNARLIQVGYDYMDPGPMGYQLGGAVGGDVDLVRRLNHHLREQLPAGAYFVDLEQISGNMGRAQFYDPRRYFWTRQPFSDEGATVLAKHLWAGIRATLTGPKKVLVLDLDNTLWGGVVGETGPFGLQLRESPDGEAYRDFQCYLQGLARRGCLLAVCSKNNPEDAREPFEKNPDMVLALDDFVAFEASWEPKATVIERIAAELRLGLDSFVFFDDEPAEREQVRQALPEVEVVDVPPDAADFRRTLVDGLWFESVQVTTEDQLRTSQYRGEKQRELSRATCHSIDDYLASLDMNGEVRPIDEADLDRAVQLMGKTNQFNLTSRRHSRDEVMALMKLPESIGLTLRMTDRFGDYGLVSVILGVQDSDDAKKTLRIDSWLMSCRVIGRSAEHFFFNALLEHARSLHYSKIISEYIPSGKNKLVQNLYDELGFTRRMCTGGDSIVYELDLKSAVAARSFVQGGDFRQ